VTAEEILAALACPGLETEPLPDVQLPEHLVDAAYLAAALEVRRWRAGVRTCVCAGRGARCAALRPPCHPCSRRCADAGVGAHSQAALLLP
jgi:hypothetical protein